MTDTAGIAAGEGPRLPSGDTRKIEKAEKKAQEDVELGRRFGLEHADDGSRDAGDRRERSDTES